MPAKKSALDAVLGDISDSDDSSSGASAGGSARKDESGARSPAEDEAPAPKRKKLTDVKAEDLMKHGYKTGPSVLFMKDKQDIDYNFAWGDGRDERAQGEPEEDFFDRERTRVAANEAAAQSADLALRTIAHAAKLREQAREEKQARRGGKEASVNQKEKRKRNLGQQGSGKNYVEEEKRVAREFGMYSGFD
ncbi:unnamed protein product [Pedinophyceae sp. YPF-701]|nr:unnamed protein product [Pedinophyceae sp. YPF-701]